MSAHLDEIDHSKSHDNDDDVTNNIVQHSIPATGDFHHNQIKNGGPNQNLNENQSQSTSNKKEWVKFEDDDGNNDDHQVNDKINESNGVKRKTKLDTAITNPLAPTDIPLTLQDNNDEQISSKPSSFESLSSTTIPSPVVTQPSIAPAVLTTESVHISVNNKLPQSSHPQMSTSAPAIIDIPISPAAAAATAAANANPGLRTIELSTGRVREGFANGDVIVTLLPVNTKWPWITPAVFRPELVPEELMAQGLTLTVEEYVHAMETLVNDFRFTIYNICYKRILCVWILFAFTVLLALLFCGLTGITLFSLGVGWLFLNAAAIFLCMWIKLRLSRGLERCMASVNKQLLRHKIILALDDRGKITCHKVNLCFIYYEPAQCVAYLNEFIERSEQTGTIIEPGWEERLDVSANDIVIQGSNTTRVSRKQALGEELFLRYVQRWGKEFLRRRLDWIVEENGLHETPRHLQSSMCPCQYAEQVLFNKPKPVHSRRTDSNNSDQSIGCCARCNQWTSERGFKFC